jgi:hypothetical protein
MSRLGYRIYFCVAFILGVSSLSYGRPPTISEETARKLVREALVAMGETQPSVQIEPWKFDWAPEFYTFSAWRPGAIGKDGVGIAQTYYFAVNPWTGDVWDAMACKRITSTAIEKEQEAIWKQSDLPTAIREAIRKKSPADCTTIQREMNRKKK